MNIHWLNRLKLIINNSRAENRDLRFGQYLYTVLCGHKEYPSWDKSLTNNENRAVQDRFLVDQLFNIESDPLLLLVENFEKKQNKG